MSLKMGRLIGALLAICVLCIANSTHAKNLPPVAAPAPHVDVADLPPPVLAQFDAQTATDRYLATISAEDRKKSAAYQTGGYYLSAGGLIYTIAIAAFLLWSRVSAWMRNLAASLTRSKFWQTPIYIAQYIAAVTVAELPLSFYQDYIREHDYGFSNQSLGDWAGEFAIGFVISLVGITILLTLIYAVARKLRGGNWWAWGGGIAIAFMAVMMMVAPVFVSPLFNHYQPLKDGPVRAEILSLARANGVPSTDVYYFDASKQTKKISANVSGFLGTTRISLNDNLLNGCSKEEILAVMAHEIGHYVLNHAAIMLTWFGLMIVALFWLVDKAFKGLTNLFGGNWDVRHIGDPAGLPLVMALFSFFLYLSAPITNTIVRTAEIQADYFGLNAARQPDGFAKVILKLSYRNPTPTPFEEFWFYDHPSGRNRILAAMRWKAEHLRDPDIRNGPVSP